MWGCCMLHELPPDHPDRCRPLLGARYRWKHGKLWRKITPAFGIAANCFNDLGPAWTDNDIFTFDVVCNS